MVSSHLIKEKKRKEIKNNTKNIAFVIHRFRKFVLSLY